MKREDAWVLQLKEDSAIESTPGPHYFSDNADFTTENLNEAEVIMDKDVAIAEMKAHEKYMIEKFGDNAFANGGYTKMMENFEFVEVVLESEE